MKFLSVCFFISNYLYAQNITERHIERLNKLKEIGLEDLAHENLGCPENSLCSKEMGNKLKDFDRYFQLHDHSVKNIEAYRMKNGLPVQFKIHKDKIKVFDAMAFKSQCESDSLKDIFTGMHFFKNLPASKDLGFNQYKLENGIAYHVPLNASPISLINKDLITVISYDDYVSYLQISPNGKWKATQISKNTLKKATLLNETTECEGSICLNIWDQTKEKLTKLEFTNPCLETKSRERKTTISDIESE